MTPFYHVLDRKWLFVSHNGPYVFCLGALAFKINPDSMWLCSFFFFVIDLLIFSWIFGYAG